MGFTQLMHNGFSRNRKCTLRPLRLRKNEPFPSTRQRIPCRTRQSNHHNLITVPLTERPTSNNQVECVYSRVIFPTLFLCNTRSLVNKLEDLEVVINENHVDIVSMTETWLTNYVSNLLIEIDNYLLVRKDRNVEKRGGGVFGAWVFLPDNWHYLSPITRRRLLIYRTSNFIA